MDVNGAVGALSALAQSSRLDVFRLLVRTGPLGLAAGEIADRLSIPANTLSFHLAQLSRAGLVTPRRAGRSIFYAADYAGMQALLDFLVENCCEASSGCAPAVPTKERNSDGVQGRRRRR